MAVAVAFAAALVSLFLALLAAVIVRHCLPRRDAGGFVLFDVCFHDDRQRRGATARPPPSLERIRARRDREREHAPGVEGAADEEEPDEREIARWKKIFGGPDRSLSTIDEGTEKGGTTPITTPAFCTPPASPDRRETRALDVAAIAARLQA